MTNDMTNKIHYTKPSITELEVRYATDAAANGWGEKCYDYINKFEELFKAHLDVKYAIATSSCTGALHMGLAALGIKQGDEVILADINWIATAAPITYLGAKPIFVDVLPDTWCINPEKVQVAITTHTKAIVAVHLYGNLCDMDALRAVGERHGIPVIEDAAEAIGSIYHGNKAGSLGAFGVFSFHGTKTITTGEGGMFVTNNDALYTRVLTLNNHGRSHTSKQFYPGMIGYKYKMSNIQAAIGCAQMERIDELVAKKRHIFGQYQRAFSKIKGIAMNPEKRGTVNGYWMPSLVFDKSLGFHRETLLQRFKQHNIDGRVFFYPLSTLPMFERQCENQVSYDIYERSINLPSYHDLTDEDAERVVEEVKLSIIT
jgi:perosamine synthetase